jgi:hypothetical protein
MGRRKVHWSERMTCSCGASFTDMYREAVHRHNFPALCKRKKTKAAVPENTKAAEEKRT